jgi:hypothetical protein
MYFSLHFASHLTSRISVLVEISRRSLENPKRKIRSEHARRVLSEQKRQLDLELRDLETLKDISVESYKDEILRAIAVGVEDELAAAGVFEYLP